MTPADSPLNTIILLLALAAVFYLFLWLLTRPKSKQAYSLKVKQ